MTGEHDAATSDASPGSTVLRIEGELTIYRAAELCADFKTALAGGGDLEIDLSEVTEMDSAGVQLLIAASKAAQAGEGELRLVGHSPAVLEVFALLDLGAHLGAPSSLSPA